MSEPIPFSNPMFSVRPVQVEGFDSLAELALNLRWSWNHATDEVWRQLDPAIWENTHKPRVVLQTAPRDHVERVLANPDLRKSVDSLVRTRRERVEAPAWFQQNHAGGSLTH